MRSFFLAATLGGLLLAAAAGAVFLWFGVETEISTQGLFALLIGVSLSLALGIGLMALVFYSSRSGHDDDAGR